jgi:RNA polymerase sigma-70 factor (ECF subfamily)
VSIGEDFPQVLAAAQLGAEWAFGLLYRDLNAGLLRYLCAQAPEAGEDLASEAWLAAARNLRSFSGDEASFRAWMFTIARRRLVEHWRERGRRPSEPAGPDSMAELAGAAGHDTEALALSDLGAAAAARAIARALPPDQADVVLLRVLGGLGVDQVAAMLGKRPGTVRVLQHKALRRLAKVFPAEVLTS